MYLANPKTAVTNLVDKEKSKVKFSGGGTGKSKITYDAAIGGKEIVLQEKVDYYIINGTAYLYNSVDTRMVVDLAAYRKSTGAVQARNYVQTLEERGIAAALPGTVGSQMVYTNAAVNDAYQIYVGKTTKFGDIYNGKDGRQHYTDHDKYGPPPPVQDEIDVASVQQAFQDSIRGGDWDGVYGLQCVDFSWWFIDTYTTLNTSYGDGKDIVANLVAANPDKLSVSTEPQPLSIFSVAAGYAQFGASGGDAGHTGIVLSVDRGNGTVTILDSYNRLSGKTPNSRILTVPYPTSNSSITFTYIGDYLK